MKRYCVAVIASLMVVTVGELKADVIVNVVESGPDVVFSSSGGAFDLTGLAFGGGSFLTGNGQGAVDAADSLFILGGGNPMDFYTNVTLFPANFGLGSLFINSTGFTGTGFGASSPAYGPTTTSLLVPTGYVSGAALGSTSSTYTSQSFASLGLTTGGYVWSWGQGLNQSLTLNIVPSQVPEPFTLGLLGLGLLGLGLSRKRQLKD